MKKLTPEVFIKAVRDSFLGSEQVYTQGSCIMFYKILKLVFPDAKPYWSREASHMLTKIGDKYWDITGEVTPTPDYQIDDVEEYRRFSVAVAIPQKKVAHRFYPVKSKL